MRLKFRVEAAVRKLKERLGIRSFLCDRCVYNNPRDCRHRERPYATLCEDYRRK